MDVDALRRYITLRDRKAQLEDELEEVKRELDEAREEQLTQFERNGVKNMTVDGRLAYLHRQLWASQARDVTKADYLQAIREAGLEHFITEQVSAQSISGYVRDLEREGEELPPALQRVLALREQWDVRVRRAG